MRTFYLTVNCTAETEDELLGMLYRGCQARQPKVGIHSAFCRKVETGNAADEAIVNSILQAVVQP